MFPSGDSNCNRSSSLAVGTFTMTTTRIPNTIAFAPVTWTSQCGNLSFLWWTYLIALVGPVHAYIFNDIRSTTIEARIPYTEPKSDAEFFVYLQIQSISGLHGTFAYIGVECLLSILENVVTIMPLLIIWDLVQTIQQYEDESITEQQLNLKMLNIVTMSRDADEFRPYFSTFCFHCR